MYIYIYMYVYIKISFERQTYQNMFSIMFIYTISTLNLIETLKITIYRTKHTEHTKLQFRKRIVQKQSFQQLDIH